MCNVVKIHLERKSFVLSMEGQHDGLEGDVE